MKEIRCLKDFTYLSKELPADFIEYLKVEFDYLYEYLGNNVELREFILEKHNSMIIFDDIKELNTLSKINIEFIEDIKLNKNSCFRVGVYEADDIQLHYCLIKGE